MITRNTDREMYIYKARKEDRRTFSDIGQELGISQERARQIYMRVDWDLNGLDADHRREKPGCISPFIEVTKDPQTGKTVVICKKA